MNVALRAWQTVVLERRLPWRVEQHPLVQRWLTARYRDHERRLMGRFVNPGDLVFDIGANVGHKTQAALAHGARVVAVEPDARNFAALERVRWHPRVMVVHAAVGSAPGHVTFYPAEDSARSSCAPDHVSGACAFLTPETVPVVTLDDLLVRYGRPQFIKIDVEGYEPAVLAGLSTPVPVLCFEFHGDQWADLRACVARLTELGMTRFNVLLYPVGGVKPYHPLHRLYWREPVSGADLLERLDRLPRPLAGDVYAFLPPRR